MEKQDRKLTGVFFRAQREDGKWDSIDFGDLTQAQREQVMGGRNNERLKSMIMQLGVVLDEIGEQFDIAKD